MLDCWWLDPVKTKNMQANLLFSQSDESVRVAFSSKGYVTVKDLLGRNPQCPAESEAVVKELLRVGWRRGGRGFVPPRKHPVRMAPDVGSSDSHNSDFVRGIVGRSQVPQELQAEFVHRILNRKNQRKYVLNANDVYAHIHLLKKELVNPESEEDQQLRADVEEALEGLKDVIDSRPNKYVTAAELIEYAWMLEPTNKYYRTIAAIMRKLGWPKKSFRENGQVLHAYTRPIDTNFHEPPPLEGLDAYLTGRHAVMELDILRDVSSIAPKAVTHSDKRWLGERMKELGWFVGRSQYRTNGGKMYYNDKWLRT